MPAQTPTAASITIRSTILEDRPHRPDLCGSGACGMVDICLAVSVLSQVLMLWLVSRALRVIETRDFSVYRIGPATGPAVSGR